MEFDKSKYKVITSKNWMIIHWMINPGLVINEVILGQRVPKVQLEDLTSKKPRYERSIVPCPHCHTMHDARTWSTINGTAFKNWFGLYCPHCGKIIPCVVNVFSFIIWAVTFPIWGWFRKSLRKRWLEKQPERYKDLNLIDVYNPFDDRNWFKSGMIFGFSMFIIMGIIFPLIARDPITFRSIVANIVTWTIGGLVFGFSMRIFSNKTIEKVEDKADEEAH